MDVLRDNEEKKEMLFLLKFLLDEGELSVLEYRNAVDKLNTYKIIGN